MTEARLERFLDGALGGQLALQVTPMVGGGSCEIFSLDRGEDRWVLRRAPAHASSATAHDVLREFRILNAIAGYSGADRRVRWSPAVIPSRVRRALLRHGAHRRAPSPAGTCPTHGPRFPNRTDGHSRSWSTPSSPSMPSTGGPWASATWPTATTTCAHQLTKWLTQLDSYGGRELPAARQLADWLDATRPADQPSALCHGDYKLDNVLFAPSAPPELLAVVDWEMAGIGDPLVDLAWALIFHPGPEGTLRLGMAREPTFDVEHLPDRRELVERYTAGSGRDTTAIGWYDVFARWKLALVLEGSYAKFLRGLSDKPIHEFFGGQVDLLLASAAAIIDQGDTT